MTLKLDNLIAHYTNNIKTFEKNKHNILKQAQTWANSNQECPEAFINQGKNLYGPLERETILNIEEIIKLTKQELPVSTHENYARHLMKKLGFFAPEITNTQRLNLLITLSPAFWMLGQQKTWLIIIKQPEIQQLGLIDKQLMFRKINKESETKKLLTFINTLIPQINKSSSTKIEDINKKELRKCAELEAGNFATSVEKHKLATKLNLRHESIANLNNLSEQIQRTVAIDAICSCMYAASQFEATLYVALTALKNLLGTKKLFEIRNNDEIIATARLLDTIGKALRKTNSYEKSINIHTQQLYLLMQYNNKKPCNLIPVAMELAGNTASSLACSYQRLNEGTDVIYWHLVALNLQIKSNTLRGIAYTLNNLRRLPCYQEEAKTMKKIISSIKNSLNDHEGSASTAVLEATLAAKKIRTLLKVKNIHNAQRELDIFKKNITTSTILYSNIRAEGIQDCWAALYTLMGGDETADDLQQNECHVILQSGFKSFSRNLQITKQIDKNQKLSQSKILNIQGTIIKNLLLDNEREDEASLIMTESLLATINNGLSIDSNGTLKLTIHFATRILPHPSVPPTINKINGHRARATSPPDTTAEAPQAGCSDGQCSCSIL